jgi:hypothetical protein
MTRLNAHQKQFVLGPAPVSIRPDWITVRIAEDLVLSHCPKLPVAPLRAADGGLYWLLGLAVPADERATIADLFPLKPSADIENWTSFWAGRWLLVSADWCLQDASGCLGTYYRKALGRVWISSSPALLGERLPDAPPAPCIPWRIANVRGIDWIPGPFTTREEVYKLLPQRTISPRDGAMRPVRSPALGLERRGGGRALATGIATVMANWAGGGFRQHFIGLTAGLDTRTVLAAACGARLDVRAFTAPYPTTQAPDLRLPPRLAAAAGIPHTLVRPAALDPATAEARWSAISEHMDGATYHPISQYLARCADSAMEDGASTFAAGNCFEIGRCIYWGKFARAGLGEAPPSAEQLLAVFMPRTNWRPDPLPWWQRAAEAWIASLSEPVPLALDWRDRFYLEQRLGSWHSNVARQPDLLDSARFYPANSLWMFRLLLQPSPEQREQGFAQREAIRILAPRLLRLPVNPRPLSERLRQGARSLLGPDNVQALKRLARLVKPARTRRQPV